MRAAERELAEIERKKQAADAMTASNARPRDSADLSKSRMDALLKEIKAESQRLAQARLQLQKLKSVKAANAGGGGKEKAGTGDKSAAPSVDLAKGESAAVTEVAESSKAGGKGKPKVEKAAAAKKAGVDSSTSIGSSRVGVGARNVPDELLPELCK